MCKYAIGMFLCHLKRLFWLVWYFIRYAYSNVMYVFWLPLPFTWILAFVFRLPPCVIVLKKIPTKGLGCFFLIFSFSLSQYSPFFCIAFDNRIEYIIETNVNPIRQIYQCFCLHNNRFESGWWGRNKIHTRTHTYRRNIQNESLNSIEKRATTDTKKSTADSPKK